MAKAKKTTKKVATKKATTKKAATKKVAKSSSATTKKAPSKRKPNEAFMRPKTPSANLAAVIGSGPFPPTQVIKKLWEYIHKNKLQDTADKRNINADDKLKALFGKSVVSMFEMTKIVSKNLK